MIYRHSGRGWFIIGLTSLVDTFVCVFPNARRQPESRLVVWIIYYWFFPTFWCGVLVFGWALPRLLLRLRLPPPPHTQLAHTQLTHTHNLLTHNLSIIIGIIVFETLSREDSELIADAWHCDLLWGWFCHCWCVGVRSVFGYWDVLSNFMHMHFCVHMSCILYGLWIGNSRYISIISGAQVSWTSYHCIYL